MQGWRESMEDAHISVLSMDNHPNSGFFGVFDGHCGKQASKFCSEKMYNYVDKVLVLDDTDQITQQIIKLDSEFMENYPIDDGTTAIFSIVNPVIDEAGNVENYQVIVGNIGDSRAVLGKPNGDSFALSEDHKPGNTIEQKRIEAAGGFVSLNRVRGNLALSRAIGDRAYKIPKDFPPERQQVSCIPDYESVTVQTNDFIFIACDGIYEGDIFSVDSVIKWITDKLNQTDDLAKITADLLEECVMRGSRDNMSAMIIQLKDGTDYNRENEYIPGPYHEGPRHQEFQDAYKLFAEHCGYSLEESRQKFSQLHPETTNGIQE